MSENTTYLSILPDVSLPISETKSQEWIKNLPTLQENILLKIQKTEQKSDKNSTINFSSILLRFYFIENFKYANKIN